MLTYEILKPGGMMQHRDGGKFIGSHTTVLDTTGLIADIAAKRPEVTKINVSVMAMGKGVAGGQRRLKFSDAGPTTILVTVRQSRSVQELWIHSTDVRVTKLALARAARDRRIAIKFGHPGSVDS